MSKKQCFSICYSQTFCVNRKDVNIQQRTMLVKWFKVIKVIKAWQSALWWFTLVYSLLRVILTHHITISERASSSRAAKRYTTLIVHSIEETRPPVLHWSTQHRHILHTLRLPSTAQTVNTQSTYREHHHDEEYCSLLRSPRLHDQRYGKNRDIVKYHFVI